MSERLEGIKNVLHMRTYQGRPLSVPFDPDDIDWLIGQAEENKRLKEQLDKAETLIKKIYRIAGASAEVDVKLWKDAEGYLGGRVKAREALEVSTE